MIATTDHRTLPVFVTVDLGPDDAVMGHDHEVSPRWNRTTAGLDEIGEACGSLASRTGSPLPVTWFVRADGRLREAEGDALAAYQRFGGFLDRRRADGDTIGWMPQAYSSLTGEVHHEDLPGTFSQLCSAGWRPECVRMGGCFHDDRTMASLDRLGIRVDCSALPGRQKQDRGWRMDWQHTPPQAFHPSRADYGRPGTPAWDIIELPVTMLPVQAPYDAAPLARYFNPAMHPHLLADGLAAVVADAAYLQCLLHPDELLEPAGTDRHPLVAYRREAFLENMLRLGDLAAAAGRELQFSGVVDGASRLLSPPGDSRRVAP